MKKFPFWYIFLKSLESLVLIHVSFETTLTLSGNKNDGLVTSTIPAIRMAPRIIENHLFYFKPSGISTTLFLYQDTTLKEERNFELLVKTVITFSENCISSKTSNAKNCSKKQDEKLRKKDRFHLRKNQPLFNNQHPQTMSAISNRV